MNRSTASVADRPGWSGKSEQPGGRDGYELRLGDRRQVDILRAVGELGTDPARDFDGKSCLAGTAGAGQGDEPVLGEDARADH